MDTWFQEEKTSAYLPPLSFSIHVSLSVDPACLLPGPLRDSRGGRLPYIAAPEMPPSSGMTSAQAVMQVRG